MLKNCVSSRRHAVTIAALLGLASSPTMLWAQPSDPPSALPPAEVGPLYNLHGTFEQRLLPLTPGAKQNTPTPELYQIALPVRNVKSSLMAYWLDPTHHPVPHFIEVSRALGQNESLFTAPQLASTTIPRFPGNGNGPADLKLPAGVTSVEADDPMNTLVATGTKEGLRALDTLIPTLDVPLVQFEVVSQFLQVSRADLPKLGLKLDRLTEDPPYPFGAVTVPLINLPIPELVRDRGAKIRSAPRVTLIDGLTGELRETTSTPFSLDLGDTVQNARFRPTAEREPGTDDNRSVGHLATVIGIRATANQAKDNLITISVTPTFVTRTLFVTATVRDGQPFVIQLSPPQDDDQIVVIVTPRRIRRATG